jgi:SOS-response transcriptional repressor LexA
MSNIKPRLLLHQILSRLMINRGLRERDLIQATGLSQTTVNNILKGKIKNPRPTFLKSIAKVFGLTLEQLVDYQSLAVDVSEKSSEKSIDFRKKKPFHLMSKPITIPLIKENEIRCWLSNQSDTISSIWIVNDSCRSSKAFALKAKPSMRSYFIYDDVTLLIDPEALVRDGLIILICLEGSKEPYLRTLTIEGERKWLQPLEKNIPATLLTENDYIVGVVAEIRHNPLPGLID